MTFGQILYIYHMKRIAFVFLLSIFLFNFICYYPVFLAVKSDLRNDALSSLSHSSHLNAISVPKYLSETPNSRFRMIDENEFSLDGKLYDVQKKTDDGKTLTFYCMNDEKEQNLFNSLGENVQMQNGTKDASGNNKTVNLNPLELFFMPGSLFSFSTNNISIIFDRINTSKILSGYLTCITPPPDSVS